MDSANTLREKAARAPRCETEAVEDGGFGWAGPAPVTPAGATVLVVEDDAAVAEIYQLALEAAGYAVRVAKDGLEGLRLAAEILPDLVFLDIRMPNLDGIGVLRGLAADPATSGIPTVMLSNFDDPAVVRESLSLGAKEYLVKAGTDPTRLAAVVARWVGASRT